MRCTAPAAAALLLALAACGGSDGTGPDDTDVPATIQLGIVTDTLTWIGDSVTLQAIVLNASGLQLAAPVTFQSSDPTVATVSTTGTVTAVSNGNVAVTAMAGTVSAVALVTVRQEAVALAKVSGDGQSADAGSPLGEPLVVRADDQGGTPVEGVVVTWTAGSGSGSATPSLGTTDDAGLASTSWTLGGAQEAQTIAASLPAGAQATFGATAVLPPPGSMSVTGVQPGVLVEGQAATITGAGFSATPSDNVVTIDGVQATVTSATSTTLTVGVPVFDCRPPRDVTLTVQRGADQASAPTSVTPRALLGMAVGEGLYTPVGQVRCLHLAAGGIGREYLIGLLSASETPTSLTPARLFAVEGSVGVAESAVAAAGPAEPSVARSGAALGVGLGARMPRPMGMAPGRDRAAPAPDVSARSGSAVMPPLGASRFWRDGEARVRAAERALIERLGGEEGARAAVVAPHAAGGPQRTSLPVPSVGDTLTLFGGFGCSSRPTVRAVARLVGERTVWLDDVENPGPSFTAAELQALDDVYVNSVDAQLTSYYGEDGDVDLNDRVFVLMTKTVNEEENLAGYVWSGDLFAATSCLQSNEGEIFYGYVPDPDGAVGQARSKESVLRNYPSLMTHEIAHLRQFAQVFFAGATSKSQWEIEGGATLAEQLAGYAVNGHGPRQNLGHAEWQAGGSWYSDWVNDLARYQGYVSSTSRTEGAPEQCSWLATGASNVGPCAGPQRAAYGVPSTLLRYVLDVWGPGYAGGEQALMRRLTSSTRRGYANLEGETGEPIESILAGFGAMLWMDGQNFDTFASWDVWGVFGNLNENARLRPYTSALVEPGLNVEVRGGSTAFLRWFPLTAHGPTSLRLKTPADGTLPATMVLWITRLR